MRIAIDARAYSWTGIGSYTRMIIRELVQLSSAHEFIILLSKKDRPKFETEYPDHSHIKVITVDASYYSWREQTIFWQQLERIEADLFHFTHFNLPAFFSKPYIVTIHDATRFIFSGQRQQGLGHQMAYEWVFKRAIERARGIISVSQATADELQHLPVQLSDTVKVIHEGVDSLFKQPITSQQRREVHQFLKTNDPYLLFVGVWMNHKNIERLLQAFAILRKEQPALQLVITGKAQPGYVDVAAAAKKYGVQDAVLLPGFVPHTLLPALYAEAAVFVFPSLYEGFGLPVLEAAACGTPVICSNVSSLPEVMGQAALYANPDSVHDIARALKIVLNNEKMRTDLIAAGKSRSDEFSWKKAAEQTLHMYEECGTVKLT